MKRKIILMVCCSFLLLFVFVRSVYVQVQKDEGKDILDNQGSEQVISDKMTLQEAWRLVSYLGLDEEEEETGTTERTVNLTGYLNYGQSKEILLSVCNLYELDEEAVKDKLSFDLEGKEANEVIRTAEFLNLYECMAETIPEEKSPVAEKNLFVLGSPESGEEGEDSYQFVTDEDTYNYQEAMSYDCFYTNGSLDLTAEAGEGSIGEFNPANYTFSTVKAMVSGDKLIYIMGSIKEETTLHNVFITSGKESSINTFINGITVVFDTKYKLSQEIQSEIGDLVIEDKEIIKISIKPDTIDGKVLVANNEYIELEGYGKIELDPYYKIYKVYDELSMEVTNSILVGYDATDFVVADGKIVAALIKEKIKAKNIRVIIKTNDYADIYHEKMQLTATKDFTVTIGKETKTYKAGEKVTFKSGDEDLEEGRVIITSKSESGKIKLLSIKRSSGTPAYRGTIEIASTEEGLIIINELSIEEYLYAVIPSEMPVSYGIEALKAQAICARSYAYNQVFNNAYSEFGAHVDDSSSYQVYNNQAESEESILAVKDTYGKVIQYDDSVINAYYFSTSCGHTASVDEVWVNAVNTPYLAGALQVVSDTKDQEAVYASENDSDTDLSSESAFKDFLTDTTLKTYDSEFSWYRWTVTESMKDITQSVDNNLASRYKANPELIQTLVEGKVDKDPEYESKSISTVGTVEEVRIGKREKSGLVSEIIIIGTKATIKVQSEYNIRALLAPINSDIIRQDDSKVSNFSMLPSGFFYIAAEGDSITIHGGGYGHGVGMSQNGAKAMADLGFDCETIIKHYYNGVTLSSIY